MLWWFPGSVFIYVSNSWLSPINFPLLNHVCLLLASALHLHFPRTVNSSPKRLYSKQTTRIQNTCIHSLLRPISIPSYAIIIHTLIYDISVSYTTTSYYTLILVELYNRGHTGLTMSLCLKLNFFVYVHFSLPPFPL